MTLDVLDPSAETASSLNNGSLVWTIVSNGGENVKNCVAWW